MPPSTPVTLLEDRLKDLHSYFSVRKRSAGSGEQRASSQTIFSTLLKCTDGSYVIKPVKVKIEARSHAPVRLFYSALLPL